MPAPRHSETSVPSGATPPPPVGEGPFVFDGGDLACGQLLMGLLRALTAVADGTTVRVIATDPAAPIDIPAWCHLTGHGYLDAGTHTDGRPCYHLRYDVSARRTRPGRPWHLDTIAPGVSSHTSSLALKGNDPP